DDNGRTEPLFSGDPADMVLKFEANAVNPGSAVGLSFIFAPRGTTNGALYEDNKPRAKWMPWRNSGSYQTNGWVTVSIPITEFKYHGAGTALSEFPAAYENLDIFLANRGLVYTGTACDPIILIDNLRIVPQ